MASKKSKVFRVLFRIYPELKFSVQDDIVDRNKASIAWTNQGIHKSGKPYDNHGLTILKLIDDKIIYLSDYFGEWNKIS